MISKTSAEIVIEGAKTNNLKNISLCIPHNTFIVVTGISGSGKSSLAFEIIAKEGQRRYFETLPSFARQFMGKLHRPDVEKMEGLSPVIAIGQGTTGMHARSTVGTMSDIYDLLRLLYARTGLTDRSISLSRALFSFNSEIGKCQRCNGIGKEEQIDLNRLIISPEKSIRDGALAPTLPNGYIMYSQVTIDVLNQVCEAEGFHVDIPWNQLSDAQQNVILNGSDKIKVPFGKHSLESRLKWTGIKAKPREEGYYKGMIPIMSDILRRDRNANILKYVHAVTCPNCKGNRLNENALSVHVHGLSIADIVRLELNELKVWIRSNTWSKIAREIVDKIESQIDLLEDLGLGHLSLNRPAKSLRSSEIQRIRIANQILVPLSDVLYVFDEPSIGLHPEENERLIHHFKRLVAKGNTVIVVEHDLDTITNADHIIEIGPKAGTLGGELIYNGALSEFIENQNLYDQSPTLRAISNRYNSKYSIPPENTPNQSIRLFGCHERNLKNIDVSFQLGKLNVVSGRSGVGKASLVRNTLLRVVKQHLGMNIDEIPKLKGHEHIDRINKLIFIDHSPIGKTPRSNPATYLGLSDHIRDIFARLPESKTQGFTKSRFSFNNKGGRCEHCQGAGKTQIGMHFLGNIDLTCGHCNGDRFNPETLDIKYLGLSIADVYKLSIDEAIAFFKGQDKVLSGLKLLQEIGLGYLTLGQSSTTLSGGEAQRIKIANQLQKKDTGDTLYVINEPSIGLHPENISSLVRLFERIKQKGNTIICIEQDECIIHSSDWHIELGPKSGSFGGQIVHQGIPTLDVKNKGTFVQKAKLNPIHSDSIILHGITTHGLKNIDVRIPKNQLTVVTGVSGSGKSSLVYDTLLAEANARFTESLSTYNRSFIQQNSEAKIKSYSGLGPAIGINRKVGNPSKRSTVGTLSGVYDAFRLLYSRIAQLEGEMFTAQHFSFNHHLGACETCKGLGVQIQCNPKAIIVSPEKSIFDGALSKNKALAYYADTNGQFMATLQEAAQQNDWNINLPWNQLNSEITHKILYGTGETIWNATWKFNTKSRSGTQEIQAKWLGFCGYINDEYQRKRLNKNIKHLESLLHDVICSSCHGSRLKSALLKNQFLGKNIHEITQLSISDCLTLFDSLNHMNHEKTDLFVQAIGNVVIPSIKNTLNTIVDLGLEYLSLDRPVNTLSGGERQRITLAGQLSTHLFGVTYVLDEPSIGLDNDQIAVLTKVLKRIVQNGNTVVVVEHDPSFIRTADYLIEMGPAAGRKGGSVLYQGKPTEINQAKDTVTYKMLQASTAFKSKKWNPKGTSFGIKGAFANNLKNIDVDFHSKQIIALTGVSGSGKSSLIKEVLYRSWEYGRPIHCTSTYGMDQFEEVSLIDQQILSQSRLTTPASYTGLLDSLKMIFSKTKTAKKRGLKKADFSYQSKKGKCTSCAGHGKLKTSMDFMSDIWLICDSCKGMRYNEEILSCLYQGRSIGEVLTMTVDEAIDFFKDGIIVGKLEIIRQIGIGHILLGQAGNSLSGGETQRLKLAKSLLQKRKGSTLYLFDEPSTGLHYFDILPLIQVFQVMIERGDTVLFIEHNDSMISAADCTIKLGPGSGDQGGKILFSQYQ